MGILLKTFELYCTHPSQYTWQLFGSHLYVISFSLRTHDSDVYQCLGFSVNSRELGQSGGKLVFSSSMFYLISQTLINISPMCFPAPCILQCWNLPHLYNFLPTCLIRIMNWVFLVYHGITILRNYPAHGKLHNKEINGLSSLECLLCTTCTILSFTCLFNFTNLKFYILYFSKVTKLREAMQLVQDHTVHKQQHIK